MIQIDDAGNGVVLGGEAIGALRVETGEYHCKILPLSAYSLFELFRTLAARDAVLELLQQLKPGPQEEIIFCTGDIFKDAKASLTARHVLWQEQKITGALQELVEASFFNSLRRYGLPERFRPFHHDYHKFHNLVFKWVCQDLAHRSHFCKPLRLNSGLIARAKIYRTMSYNKQTCAHCHTQILPFSLCVVDRCEPKPSYFHLHCFPAEVTLADYQEEVINGEPVRCFINRFSSPPVCASCGQKIKYKKRIISLRDRLYHFTCFPIDLAHLQKNFLTCPP